MDYSSLGAPLSRLQPTPLSMMNGPTRILTYLSRSDLWTCKTGPMILPSTISPLSVTIALRLALGNEPGKYSCHDHTSAALLLIFFFSPGRFVAAMILKTLLAHLLMTFDLKPAEELPRNQEIKSMIPIDPKAKIMLRKRMDWLLVGSDLAVLVYNTTLIYSSSLDSPFICFLLLCWNVHLNFGVMLFVTYLTRILEDIDSARVGLVLNWRDTVWPIIFMNSYLGCSRRTIYPS